MTNSILARLFEHSNWANLRIIQVCSILSDEQLDAEPHSVTRGSIRQTLIHLVRSQRGYLSLMTMPVEARRDIPLAFADLAEAAHASGTGLLALTNEETPSFPKARLRTTDGYIVEPWVVMVQAISHAAEHREQICSMLSALGITPPDLDGWAYGEATGALVPI